MSAQARRILLPLAAVMTAALAVTVMEGVPAPLPGVALGSTVLLHVERAAALFAIAVAVISVLTQAVHGRLPTQLSTSGIAYDAEEPSETAAALAQVQHEVDLQRAALDSLADLIDTIETRL